MLECRKACSIDLVVLLGVVNLPYAAHPQRNRRIGLLSGQKTKYEQLHAVALDHHSPEMITKPAIRFDWWVIQKRVVYLHDGHRCPLRTRRGGFVRLDVWQPAEKVGWN